MSLFSSVEMAPRDPILGLSEQFAADPRPHKVNLGVGVYLDAQGKIPVLACVAQAEKAQLAAIKPKGYLPIDGISVYDAAVKNLVFGADSAPVKDHRVATVQALGGTGGLKVGADFLRELNPGAKVLISDPSWENHRALFSKAGFEVDTYPYYDAKARGVRADDMLQCLHQAQPGTIVVLHACCHNPTGYDMTPAQWDQVVRVTQERRLIPFLDMAYQGFGDGIAEDGAAVHRFVRAGLDFFVASSFSKSFSLYGERVGALSVVCQSAEESARVLSRLKIVVRTNYSSPPTHGAQLVSTVLHSPELRGLWEEELGTMRQRIQSMRHALVSGLRQAGVSQNMDYINTQKGMFSYSGLSAAQMQHLRNDLAIYGLDSGRICVAALNEGNLPRVIQAIVSVM